MLPTCDPSSACGGGSGCLDMLMIPEGFLSDVDVFGKSSECLRAAAAAGAGIGGLVGGGLQLTAPLPQSAEQCECQLAA
jgi:hypothetical protein